MSPHEVPGATAAAADGREHVTEPTAYDAILLASFGGPEGQDDVIPFLRNVTRGRGIPDERLEEVAHHYRAFGGVSPINDQNRELKAALEAELARRGIDLPVLWGNRNWHPYLSDALTQAHERGYTKLIAIGTSAYSSYSSCRQYREDYAKALDDTGLAGVIQIDKVRQFFDHPGFVTPFIEGVEQALADVADRGIAPEHTHVLFTTHSIPTPDAECSGPRDRDFGEGGAYAAQHLAIAEVVMAAQSAGRVASVSPTAGRVASVSPSAGRVASVSERIETPAGNRSAEEAALRSGLDTAAPSSPPTRPTLAAPSSGPTRPTLAAPVSGPTRPAIGWDLVYQSRSGPPTSPWLAPDINDSIRELAEEGVEAVVIVPLGFVSDHMEVKWDLDTEAMETAAEVGIHARRVPTPGTHAAFVSGLVDLVLERRDGVPLDERPALTSLGPWYDVCRPGCCENVRLGFKPALAGVSP